MKNEKRLLTLIVLIGLLVTLPVIVFLNNKRTQIKSGAAEFNGYDVFCEGESTALLTVSNPTEIYSETTGEYKLQWTVKNNSTEVVKLNTERYSCRCDDPNALKTPAELTGTDSSYAGRLCVGSWPTIMTTLPPTAAEIQKPWNYCEYEYQADLDKIAMDSATQNEKKARAEATSKMAGGPLTLQPGEEKSFERSVTTKGASLNHCGSFQLTWNITALERASGTACTIRRLPGQITSTIGILITGDGQVDDVDFSGWRPAGVNTVGSVCVAGTNSVCGDGLCDVSQETHINCPADCLLPGPSICVANNSCQPATTEEIRQRLVRGELVIQCTSGAECNVKNICYNNSCTLQRGAPGADDKICDPTKNDPATKVSAECMKTYLTCENGACVRKEGVDKQDICNPDDPLACDYVCDERNDTCQLATDIPADERGDACTGIGDDEPCHRGTPEDFICNTQTETCELIANVPTNLRGPDCLSLSDDLKCQEPVEDFICNTQTETCELIANVPTNLRGPDCLSLSDDLKCQRNDEDPKVCNTDNFACAPKSTIPTQFQGDPCQGPQDCIPTYDACRNNTCVAIFGRPPAGEEFCDLSGPDPDAVCRETPPPPITGVNGAALAVSIVSMVVVLLGLRLVL